LVDREVVELWRLDDGTITTTPQPVGPKDKQFVLDYPNAESAEELTNNATVKLIENAPEESIAINLDEIETDFKLGDVVGGKDNVTGLKISKPITQKILKIDKSGRKINYKAGE
jgi:methyl coenzyme M reductase beta subunit